jgi:hypothetical protein
MRKMARADFHAGGVVRVLGRDGRDAATGRVVGFTRQANGTGRTLVVVEAADGSRRPWPMNRLRPG